MMTFYTVLSMALFAASSFAGCYWPDGSLNSSPDYQPCIDIVGRYSMCCATNRTLGADSCLGNGLCQNFANNGQSTQIDILLWRETCTDPTWKSPYCLRLCVDGSGVNSTNQTFYYDSLDLLVTQCNDGTFCCGQNNNTCCDQGKGVSIAKTVGVDTSTATSASAPSFIASSIATSQTPSPTQPSSSTNNGNGPNIGAIVGGVIGGVCLIVVIGIAIWYVRRKTRRDATPSRHKSTATATEKAKADDSAHQTAVTHEMDVQHPRLGVSELDSSNPNQYAELS